MLYIGNLCMFVSLMIKNEEQGIFFPQNAEYVRTSDMVQEIAKVHQKKILLVKVFNPVLRLLGKSGGNSNGKSGKIGGMVNKAFGNMVYEKAMSEYREEYRIYDMQESVRLTEVE